MAFEVPKSKKDLEENQFEFTIEGETYRVPTLGYVSGAVIEMMAVADEKGGIYEEAANYAIFGPAGSPIGDAVRSLEREQLGALMEAYHEASKITTGESSASTDS